MKRFLTITLLSLYAGVALCLQEGGLLDDASLKNYLKRNFTADESMSWDERGAFKTNQKIPDEQLHRVLMEIYQEATEKRSSGLSGREEQNNNSRTIEGVLGWLPMCGDIPVKDFLMDYAVVRENDSLNRRNAVLSYLRIADAEESKKALLRFLVEGDRMDYMERLSLYEFARMVYDPADELKRSAILNALYVAASVPDLPPLEFRVCDDILVRLSSVYAQSNQRFALLNKYRTISYPENRKETMKILKERLDKMQKNKVFTNVSTNLTLLKSRDFNLPQPDLSSNDVTDVANDKTVAKSNKEGTTKRSLGLYALLGIPSLLLLGFGAWKLTRR